MDYYGVDVHKRFSVFTCIDEQGQILDRCQVPNTPVEVGGLVVCRQRPGTAKGFVFLVLEDEFGLVNVIIKPDLYERQRSQVRTEPFVIVQGKLQRRDGTVNVVAARFRALQTEGVAPEAHNFG